MLYILYTFLFCFGLGCVFLGPYVPVSNRFYRATCHTLKLVLAMEIDAEITTQQKCQIQSESVLVTMCSQNQARSYMPDFPHPFQFRVSKASKDHIAQDQP